MRFGWIESAAVVCILAKAADGASAEQWRSRSIYQLLTDRFARTDGNITAICNVAEGNFCGGTWLGIIGQLDYIQNMGFTAIWISPIVKNIPERTPFGYAYHGFWQQDLYSLNDHFGTSDDLKALSKALHDRGMYLMVDVVANHFGWDGSANTVNYSKLYPFDDKKYYHDYCPIGNYSDQVTVEDCWLGDPKVELVDLRTEDDAVVQGYSSWISELVSNYSIDGLRIDTVKHVGKPFWSTFNRAAGVFCTGEVLSGNAQYACDYQEHLDSVLNYPLYFPMIQFINSTSGTPGPLLNAISILKSECKDVTLLGTFTENHDLPRFASQTQDYALAKNALALTLLWDGIPIVYAGQEQHYAGYGDPGNREATWLAKYSRQSDLYNVIAAINQVRNHASFVDPGYLTYIIEPIYNDTNTIALRKGHKPSQVISVITNLGLSAGPSTINVENTGWDEGTAVVEVLSCRRLTVSGDGAITVPMRNGEPRVYMATETAAGSGICGINGTITTAGSARPSETKTSEGLSCGMQARASGSKRMVAAAGVVAAAVGAF